VSDQVLIYADTARFPELRHEVPLLVIDPFLYAELDGQRHVVVSALETSRIDAVGGFQLHPPEEFGQDELRARGLKSDEIRREVILRACRGIGITSAVVPFGFPVHLADHLRENGIELRADPELFERRRRAKNDAEVAGIRRAQRAAEAGMNAARELLRRATPNDGGLLLDGDPLTSERIKRAIDETFVAHGCAADEFIVAHGPQGAVGHDSGSGLIAPGEPVVIDLWPRDRESACYADMTRTFVVGEPPPEIVEWHRLCVEALERSLAETRPGVRGRALYDLACDVFEEHGHPTQRTKEEGRPLDEGFFHGLGHGVGLEVHEQPGLGIVGHEELVPGDVVTIEPGLYRQGFGGCRVEDLVLVTADGAENLTQFPYELEP
jgi:Xaa-Pro aminopeptidase